MRCLRCGKSIRESYSHNSECPLCIKCQAHEGRALITESEKDASNLDTLARLDVAEVFDNEQLHVILDNFIELEGSTATLLFQPVGITKLVTFDNTASLADPRFEPFKDILEMPAVIEENDGEYTIVIDLMEMEVTEEYLDQLVTELSKPSEETIEESVMSVDELNDNINDLMRSFRSEVNSKFADDNINEVEFIKNEYIDKVEKLVFRSEANITLNAIESAFNEVFAEMDRIVASYPEEGDYVNRNYFDRVEEAMLEDTQRDLDIEDANDRLNTLKKEVKVIIDEKKAQGASDDEIKDFLAQNMRTFNRKLTLVLDRCHLNQEDETAARKAFEDMVKSGDVPSSRVEFIKVTQEESFGYGLPEDVEEPKEEPDTYYTVFTAPSKEVYDELGNEEFVEDYLSLDEAIAKAQELVEAKACFSSEVMKITNEGSDKAWSSLAEDEEDILSVNEELTAEDMFNYLKSYDTYNGCYTRPCKYHDLGLTDSQQDKFFDFLQNDQLGKFWEDNSDIAINVYQEGRSGGHLVLDDKVLSPKEYEDIEDYNSYVDNHLDTYYYGDNEDGSYTEEQIEEAKEECFAKIKADYNKLKEFDANVNELILRLKNILGESKTLKEDEEINSDKCPYKLVYFDDYGAIFDELDFDDKDKAMEKANELSRFHRVKVYQFISDIYTCIWDSYEEEKKKREQAEKERKAREEQIKRATANAAKAAKEREERLAKEAEELERLRSSIDWDSITKDRIWKISSLIYWNPEEDFYQQLVHESELIPYLAHRFHWYLNETRLISMLKDNNWDYIKMMKELCDKEFDEMALIQVKVDNKYILKPNLKLLDEFTIVNPKYLKLDKNIHLKNIGKRNHDFDESFNKKSKASLKEGVWSVPFTQEKAIKLKRTLDRIDALTAEQVKDELYDVFGSDELFDDLENTDDLQAEIKQNLRSLLRQYSEHPASFTEVADEEALEVLNSILGNVEESIVEADEGLPTEVTIPLDDIDCPEDIDNKDEIEDIINNYLSDNYNYLVSSYDYKFSEESIIVSNIVWDEEDTDLEEETYLYVVHSDVDENNVYQEFDSEEDAIEYAKEHAVDETWVDKLTLDGDEVIDNETIWSYTDEELKESRADVPNPDSAIVFEVLDEDENIIETFTGDNVEALIKFVNSHEEAYYVTKKAPEDIDGFGYSEPETAIVSSNVFDRDMDDELTIDMLKEACLDEAKKEHPYKCEKCGANLDPGEKCDCEKEDKLEENISMGSLIKALQGKEITFTDEFYYDVIDNVSEEELADAFRNNNMVDEHNVITLRPGLKVEYVGNSNPDGAGYINFKTTNLENNFEFFISNEYDNVKEFLACTDTGLDANFDESEVDDLAEDVEDKHIEVFRNGKVTREDVEELIEAFKVGDERVLDPEQDAHEYTNMTKAAELLTNSSSKGRTYYVANTYLDRGLDWEWTTICYKDDDYGRIQVLSPRDWLAIVNAQTDDDLDNAIAQLKADRHFSDNDLEESLEDDEKVYIIVNGRNGKVMAQINDNDLYYRWCKTRTSPKVQLFTYDEAERLISNQSRFGNNGADDWYIDRIDDLAESLTEDTMVNAANKIIANLAKKGIKGTFNRAYKQVEYVTDDGKKHIFNLERVLTDKTVSKDKTHRYKGDGYIKDGIVYGNDNKPKGKCFVADPNNKRVSYKNSYDENDIDPYIEEPTNILSSLSSNEETYTGDYHLHYITKQGDSLIKEIHKNKEELAELLTSLIDTYKQDKSSKVYALEVLTDEHESIFFAERAKGTWVIYYNELEEKEEKASE